MSTIGYRITSFAISGVLCLGLSRKGAAQTADTAGASSIETTTATVYRVREPAKVPIAKSETKGQAPSKDSGTCKGIETPGKGRGGSGCPADG
jgi:hypothetical protein